MTNLYKIYKTVQSEGISQVSLCMAFLLANCLQRIRLGVHRSDYLLHESNGELIPQQVELNTIASSFSSLATKTAQLHRFLSGYTNAELKDLPENKSFEAVPLGLSEAWKAYGKKEYFL